MSCFVDGFIAEDGVCFSESFKVEKDFEDYYGLQFELHFSNCNSFLWMGDAGFLDLYLKQVIFLNENGYKLYQYKG